MTKAQKQILLISLILVIPPPFSIDEYTPSLPFMVDFFGSTNGMLQLTVTVYMFAFAISQAFFGPLSDMIGRRPGMLMSMPIFFVGNLICLFSSSIELLILGRFIMGLGVGAMAFTAPVLLADTFEGKALNRASSYFSTAYSFVPIAAPVLGGVLQKHFGWQANFICILIVSALGFCFYLILAPETHKIDPKTSSGFSFRKLLQAYGKVLGNRTFLITVLALFCVWGVIISFSVMGPFLYQNTFGLSPDVYGLCALFVGLGVLGGNLTNTQLQKKFEIRNIVFCALCAWLFMCVVFLVWFDHFSSAFGVSVLTFLVAFSTGLVFPNMMPIALTVEPSHRGTASALVGTGILTGAVLITALETTLNAHSAVSIAGVYFALGVLAATAVYFLRKDFL